MKQNAIPALLAVIAVLLPIGISLPTHADETVIAWPTSVVAENLPNADELLGPPPHDAVQFSDLTTAEFTAFTYGVKYDTAALANALNLNPETLAIVDFIAFEANGQEDVGFETSTWVFSDGVHECEIHHDFGGSSCGPLLFGNHTSDGWESFNAFFGTNFGPEGDVAILLFDFDQPAGDGCPSCQSLAVGPSLLVQLTGGDHKNPGGDVPDVIGLGIVGICPWDCGGDGDGSVGIVDFLALLAQWGTTGTCDFDGDGVGITDFLILLANWGPC